MRPASHVWRRSLHTASCCQFTLDPNERHFFQFDRRLSKSYSKSSGVNVRPVCRSGDQITPFVSITSGCTNRK